MVSDEKKSLKLRLRQIHNRFLTFNGELMSLTREKKNRKRFD